MCRLGKSQKTSEGGRSGVTRLDRMKHGSGIKGVDDRSSGDSFHKYTPLHHLEIIRDTDEYFQSPGLREPARRRICEIISFHREHPEEGI